MRIEVDRDGKLVPSFEDLGEPPVLDGYEIVRFQTVLSGDGLKVVWTQKPRAGEQPWDLAYRSNTSGSWGILIAPEEQVNKVFGMTGYTWLNPANLRRDQEYLRGEVHKVADDLVAWVTPTLARRAHALTGLYLESRGI